MTGQFFISYRHEESRWSARSLCDRLVTRFDRKQIFMDVDAIALGDDFIKEIEKKVGDCDVLIAVIGANWLTSKDDQGRRRLDNPEDFVHMEIATALRRNIRVIPVLVDGALMPLPRDLPDDLKPLVRRYALQVSDTRFDDDCRRLIGAIEQVLEVAKAEQREQKKRPEARRRREDELPPPEERPSLLQTPKGRRILAACAGVAIAVVVLVIMLSHTPTPLFAPGPSRGQVNLLAPENGGKLMVAPDVSWALIADGDDDTGFGVGLGTAVFGFKEDRSATFDTFTVFISDSDNHNIKDFQLLAGNESPTGRFESIGKFSTQNERVLQLREGRLQAHQEFHFAPVTAKYVKIRLLSGWGRHPRQKPVRLGVPVIRKAQLISRRAYEKWVQQC
jgi:hypothetical protein